MTDDWINIDGLVDLVLDWEVAQISTTSLDNGTYYLGMSCW